MKKKLSISHTLIHLVLITQCLLVLYPIYIMLSTTFKTNMQVLESPFKLPSKLSFAAYEKVLENSNYIIYYKNSIIVTTASLLIILIVSVLASYALGRYVFRGSKAVSFYFMIGMMIPIRLSVLNLFNIFNSVGLFNNLLSLIIIYSAMGIPISIFIITNTIRDIPKELAEAATIDGCGSFMTLIKIYIPLIKPAISIAAIYNFVPIWNDFYFPLIFIRSDGLKTVPQGTAMFFGQFSTDWPTAFASLTMAVIPTIIFYLLLSKQFIKGLTAGAVKG